MRNSLGISTGAAGVCSALVSSDDTGVQDVEYRTISADLGTQTDPGDLALSAIGLMTTQVPDRRIEPDAIAVAYRTESQAAAVRSAAKSQKRAIRLVPETAATLTYLRSTGLVAQYGIIALVDLGASGLTVTIVDQADGTVFFRDRTATVSADAAAETADDAGSRVAEFVTEAFAQALQRPEALVLVGGGGRIPGIASALETTFDGTTIEVAEPEAATAKGAALLAGSPERQKFPLVTGSGGRVSGALVAAVVVGGLMLGYGVKEMVPQSEENYSPTGSQVIETPTTVPYEPPPSPQETWLPTNDPHPTTTVPVPQTPLPVPTYDYSTPASSTSYPTFEETPPTTSEPSPEQTTTPTTTPPPPTTTTPPKEDLPWIPPKWPELPTWLPEIPSISPPGTEVPPTTESPETSGPAETPEQNPESGPATGSSETAAPPTTTAPPAPEAPIAAVPQVTPESGSPTPEVPDSSPR